MAGAKPTILIIHGAWHHPDHFASLIKVFHAKGYETVCPSHRTYNNGTKTLADDAHQISEILTQLVEKDGKEVVIIMHSYGGMIGTEAVSESLSQKARAASGKKGGVIHLLYMTAFLLQKGISLATPLGGKLPPFIAVEVLILHSFYIKFQEMEINT
jgi:hypothetical protein